MKSKIIKSSAIVILGSFNPAILHPSWFLNHDLVPESWIEPLLNPNSEIVKDIPELKLKLAMGNRFVVDNMQAQLNLNAIEINCQRNRLEILSHDENGIKIISEFLNKFFKILDETPIQAIGINYNFIFKTKESYDELVNSLFVKTDKVEQFFGAEVRYGIDFKTSACNAVLNFKLIPTMDDPNGSILQANFHYEKGEKNLQEYLNEFKDNYDATSDYIVFLLTKAFNVDDLILLREKTLY
jgi:hypothetical protein